MLYEVITGNERAVLVERDDSDWRIGRPTARRGGATVRIEPATLNRIVATVPENEGSPGSQTRDRCGKREKRSGETPIASGALELPGAGEDGERGFTAKETAARMGVHAREDTRSFLDHLRSVPASRA